MDGLFTSIIHFNTCTFGEIWRCSKLIGEGGRVGGAGGLIQK